MIILFKNKTDKEIAEYIYTHFGIKLFHYARKSWQIDEDEIWDILYQTIYKFIDIYSSQEFNSEEQLASLIWTIYKNKLKDAVRKNKKIQKQYKEVFMLHNYQNNIFGEKENNKTAKNPVLIQLISILNGFKDWERQLLLCRANNLPYKEIEKLTGKNAANLKVYYQRLKDKIREQLEEYTNKQEV